MLPIKNIGYKRRWARRGGEQSSCMAMLPAGTQCVPGCPLCWDHWRGDRHHQTPSVTILSSPRRIRCHQAGVVAGVASLLRRPERHHRPWDASMSPLGSPWAAQVMVVPCRITGLPWYLMAQLPTALGAVCTPQTLRGRTTMPAPGKGGTHGTGHHRVRLPPAAPACTGSRSICHRHQL